MPTPRGPVLEADTIADAGALAERLSCPVAAVISALVDSLSDDSARAEQACSEIAAWRDASAVSVRELALPSASPTLAVRLGAWTDEYQSAPFVRSGYGYTYGDTVPTIAASTRGLWRIARKKAERRTRVLGYRRGSILLHGFAESWALDPVSGRFWADEFYWVDNGEWVDADTGKRYPLDADDLAADAYLRNVGAIIPNGDRNPVAWVGGDV